MCIRDSVIQSMKKYSHHGRTSLFGHSVHVSYYNYLVCKKLHLDEKAGAKAGLLHDLFLYDWHKYSPGKGERLHGFEHPTKALKNAGKYFDITEKEGDMIAKHMLDVYKRQVQMNSLRECLTNTIHGLSRGEAMFPVDRDRDSVLQEHCLSILRSVSYTHLDVYKRQELILLNTQMVFRFI